MDKFPKSCIEWRETIYYIMQLTWNGIECKTIVGDCRIEFAMGHGFGNWL